MIRYWCHILAGSGTSKAAFVDVAQALFFTKSARDHGLICAIVCEHPEGKFRLVDTRQPASAQAQLAFDF